MISLFTFPTTVVFIDDEPNYIEHQFMKMGEKMPIRTFTDPVKALNFLNHEYAVEPLFEQLQTPGEEMLDHVVTSVDLRAIHRHMYCAERFAEISVIVVDYAMPTMNGLSMIRALRDDLNARIILLTGEAGNDLAVQAFNEGIIHEFILKSNKAHEDFGSMLEGAIRQQTALYFQQQTLQLLNANNSQAKALHNLLTDPAFIEIFDECAAKQGCVEHYLCDSEGSFVLLNAEGNSTIFALKDKQAMNDYLAIASNGDNVPSSVISALEKCTQVPLFFRDSDFMVPPAKWMPYLHHATALNGKNNQYYYAILNDAEKFGVDRADIFSFNEYLDEMDALLLKKK